MRGSDDPEDTDYWPEDVAKQWEDDPLRVAVEDDGDFLGAVPLLPEALRKNAQVQAWVTAYQRYDDLQRKRIKAPLTTAEEAESDALEDPTNEALDWLEGDDVQSALAARKSELQAEATKRAKNTIQQIEATGRYKWNAKDGTFEEQDEPQVLYANERLVGWQMVNADNESVGNAAADVIKWSYVSHSNAPQRIREDFESLEARWRKDAGANGQTSGFSLCRVSSVTNSRGRSLVQWIAAFEAVTGKQIAWVDTDQSVPLPWFAATSEERPNTIFLHVRAKAHALALVGHEWGHTLEIQDPTLYRGLQAALAKYVTRADVKKMRKGLLHYYRRGILSTEITNNVVGDFFTDPEFWRDVERNDQGLLKQLLQNLSDWFANLIQKASHWKTEGYATDIAKARAATAEVFAAAMRRGPYSEVKSGGDHLLAVATHQPQIGLPNDRREAMMKAAATLVDLKLSTPQDC
ncbi:MAG: hypothetical protein ACOYMN_07740 [Roseimicrobium sp.]